VPRGFTILHLTDEFPLAVLEPRAEEFRPLSAWLFELLPQDFVNHPDDRVRPLHPDWAGRIAKLWEPDWPAEAYVRRRIEGGPTAAIYKGGEPIAWALTHTITDRVGLIGIAHVLEGCRKTLGRRTPSAAESANALTVSDYDSGHHDPDAPSSYRGKLEFPQGRNLHDKPSQRQRAGAVGRALKQ